MAKKKIAVLMAVMLLIGVAAGTTLAWLKDSTDPLKNVFTVGDINIELFETYDENMDGTIDDGEDGDERFTSGPVQYHIVPGDKLPKNPRVVVEAESEDCYVFLRMDVATNSFTDADGVTANPAINWGMILDDAAKEGWDGWQFIDLNGNSTTPTFTNKGTYYLYREYTKNDADVTYPIIVGDGQTGSDLEFGFVTVSSNVTKGMVNAINNTENPMQIAFSAAAVQSKNIVDPNKSDIDNLKAIIAELPSEFKS